MAQSVILVRLTLGWEDVGIVREYVGDMEAVLKGVEGYVGSGAWKGVQNPHARLILFAYDSAEAARRGFAAISDLPALIERQHAGAMPADVKALTVHQSDGRFDGTVPANSLVSFSLRRADPGYGPDLVEDYEDVFAGLAMMAGYAGSLIGIGSAMEDEVVGLAAWRSEVAFAASMPEKTFYEVNLYEPLSDV